jgi:hypothetical protein
MRSASGPGRAAWASASWARSGGAGVKATEKAASFTAQAQGSGFALGRQVGLLDLAGARLNGAHLLFRLLLGVLHCCGDFLWRGELAIPGVNEGAQAGERGQGLDAVFRHPEGARPAEGAGAIAANDQGESLTGARQLVGELDDFRAEGS